jgi:hypothetical protein
VRAQDPFLGFGCYALSGWHGSRSTERTSSQRRRGPRFGFASAPRTYWGTVFYWYDTSRINNQSGDQVNLTGNLNLFAGLPLISVVTKKKFLGANYGFMVIPAAVANSSLDAPRFGQNPGAGFGDTYFQPVNLGWKFGRADVIAGFAIYAPTGRYTANNANGDNTGLGMWGFEPSIGTTVHLNEAKTWNASALASFEFHTDKRDTIQHVGNILTLEGGVGRSFLKGSAKAGLVYYAQWKLTDDVLTGLPPLLVQGKNRTTGLGPELTIPLATKSTLFGFFTFRYEWEVYARTTTQGNALNPDSCAPLQADQAQVVCSPFERSCEKCDETVARPS